MIFREAKIAVEVNVIKLFQIHPQHVPVVFEGTYI